MTTFACVQTGMHAHTFLVFHCSASAIFSPLTRAQDWSCLQQILHFVCGVCRQVRWGSFSWLIFSPLSEAPKYVQRWPMKPASAKQMCHLLQSIRHYLICEWLLSSEWRSCKFTIGLAMSWARLPRQGFTMEAKIRWQGLRDEINDISLNLPWKSGTFLILLSMSLK